MITLSVLVIGIFSAFILYDLKRVQDGEETNYITATLGVYLSIYNVFQACCRCWASSAATTAPRSAFGRRGLSPDEKQALRTVSQRGPIGLQERGLLGPLGR
jgi:hypothetical protein